MHIDLDSHAHDRPWSSLREVETETKRDSTETTVRLTKVLPTSPGCRRGPTVGSSSRWGRLSFGEEGSQGLSPSLHGPSTLLTPGGTSKIFRLCIQLKVTFDLCNYQFFGTFVYT